MHTLVTPRFARSEVRYRSGTRSAARCGQRQPSPAGVHASRTSAWRRSESRPTRTGVPVDDSLRAGERLWAIGDVTGIWELTHVGEYQGEIVASNILGEARTAPYEAVPRVTYTDPQVACVGVLEDSFSGTAPLSEVARTATYTRASAVSNGFLTSEIVAAAVKTLRHTITAGDLSA